ncbi:MAG: hypothetical protein RL368_1542 [Pseudomonadota bacterium]|jgi:TetR/AcrR family transcriptional repressor of nem operon
MGRHSDAKQRILDSARVLFHARSYSAVGIQEICDHAAVKKGSFYHFFPSKQALTLELLDQSWLGFEQAFVSSLLNPERPALQRIVQFFKLGCEMQQRLLDKTGCVLGCPFGNLAMELSTQDDLLRAKLLEFFHRMEAVLEKALLEAISAGELSEETDTKLSAKAMLAYLEGLLLMAKAGNNLQDFTVLSEMALKLITNRTTPL